MGYTLVFTGNLSFRTKADQLAEHFAAAGKVVSANIITRGPRSLGYGFVEFDTETEAQSAVELLNRKNIDGREINVELAKPREDKQQNQQTAPRRGGGFRGRGRGRGGYAPSTNSNSESQQSQDNSYRGQRQRRGGPRDNNRSDGQ